MLWLPAVSGATVKIDVIVKGVEPPLYDNVMSRLTIALQKDNPRLQNNAIRRMHQKSKQDILEALEPYGFYNPVITGTLTEGDEGWVAEYTVDKGAPVLVEDVDLQLTGAGRDNSKITAAAADFPLVAGQVLDQIKYEAGKKKLILVAIGDGYLDAAFTLKKLSIDPSKDTGRIELTLNTGPLYRFGKTTSSQNILQESLLLRYLPYKEGDPYKAAKLFELQAILYKTDYFRRVAVRGRRNLAVGQTIPVEVDLTSPEQLNKYSIGAGYGTDTGIRGKFDWANRLYNDRGHKVRGGLQLSQYDNTIWFNYEVPMNDPRYEKVIAALAYQDKTWEDTTTRLWVAGLSQEYSGPRLKYGIGLEIRDEIYDVGSTSGTSTLLLPSLNGGLIIADDILNTRDGLQASVGLKGAVEGLVSDATFIQGTISGKAILTPIERLRLIGRATFGATLVDSIDSLPPSLRFYTGGDSTIRGYAFKSIAPEDISGTVIGGRYLVVQSIEVERLFGEYWSVAGFWDGGSATDDLRLDYYQGAGVGLRFRLPFGQVRFDVASAISEDGQPIRVHLNIGGDL